MAEPILTPWVLSLSVVYVLYIQWIGHFLLKNRSQCNYPLAFRLWTYSTVNYLMKLRDIQLPSLSTYSGDICEPTLATFACMHAPSSSNFKCQVAVEVCARAWGLLRYMRRHLWAEIGNISLYLYEMVRNACCVIRETTAAGRKKNPASIVEPLPRLIHAHSLIQNAKTTELRGAQALSSKIPPGVMELRAELRCGSSLVYVYYIVYDDATSLPHGLPRPPGAQCLNYWAHAFHFVVTSFRAAFHCF